MNRLQCVPVAVAGDEPGATARLGHTAAEWLDETTREPRALARIATALDLGALFSRIGCEVGVDPNYAEDERAAGLDLMTRLAAQAAEILADGLVEAPQDLDVLAVTGLGFPAWSGGPLSFADMLRRGEIEGRRTPAALGDTVFYRD